MTYLLKYVPPPWIRGWIPAQRDLDSVIIITVIMPALVYLNAVAFVSSQNHPILIRTFGQERENNKDIRYHYIAHISLDVFEERSQSL